MIDDGSTDTSGKLCDQWALKDSRVIVLHKNNGGVSSARNVALKLFRGDYLTFVDPDDFIATDTYKINMDYLQKYPEVDMLQYPYCHYFNNDNISNFHQPKAARLEGSEEIFKNWWSGTPLEYVIWNKIYKRKVWSGIRFNEGHVSEDTCLVPKLVNSINAVYISENGLYYYQRDRLDSYTYEYNFEKHLDLFNAHAAIFECFKNYPQMTTEKVLAFTRLYRRLISAKQSNHSSDIKQQQQIVNKYFPSFYEILISHNTEKCWLIIAKILGSDLFVKSFLKYLKYL